MLVEKVLPVLLGASVLLVSQHERVWLRMPSIASAGQVDLKPGQVIRDRLKSGGNGPEMVVIPGGQIFHGRQREFNLRIKKSFDFKGQIV